MNGRRAKLIRKATGYDIKKEREEGRDYNFVFQTEYAKQKGSVTILCKGPRAWYQVFKRAAKRRRAWRTRL
jgi:hypothetical protein